MHPNLPYVQSIRARVIGSIAGDQVEANQDLNGVTAEGANILPTRVIEDAFQHQYNKTLNFTDLKAGMQKVDRWYADRGIFGQVRNSLHMKLLQACYDPETPLFCPWGLDCCPSSSLACTLIAQMTQGSPHKFQQVSAIPILPLEKLD